MADAIISRVLDGLVSIISNDVQRRWMLVTGVETEVKKLVATLTAIQAAVADAEQRRLTDKTVELWVRSLKDVSYEIDDVLEEWSVASAAASSQSRNGEERPDLGWMKVQLLRFSNLLRKVCSFFPSSCFSCCEESVGLRYNVASKVEELNETLEGIEKRMQTFSFAISSSQPAGNAHDSEHSGDRAAAKGRNLTSSVMNVEVKGREKEKGELVKMLVMTENPSQSSNLVVVSIVGMGGLGKTTLAKSVYKEVESHFDKCIWVCVSEPFDQKRIAREILEAFTGSKPNVEGWSAILESISNLGQEKRFLLVLDDAWEDDASKWEELLGSLRTGRGSRVLVTTRKESVANALGSIRPHTLQLGELPYEDIRSIFEHHAFLGWDGRERELVKDIGEKIARQKCNGVPLVAKTLGGLLRSKRSRRQWEAVLQSKAWELKARKETDLFAPLWLSYYDLSPELRQCFAYCAVFPKDHDIDRDKLIKLWMAQGYLESSSSSSSSSSSHLDLELTGENYFDDLYQRCLFQDLHKDAFEEDNYYGSGVRCRMHDLIHDFAQLVSSNECAYLERESSQSSQNARHLLVVAMDPQSLLPTVGNMKGTRSLLIDNRDMFGHNISEILPDLTSQLSSLRSLKLRSCRLGSLPRCIGKLIHLRLLDLYGNHFLNELPDEVCELQYLQTLGLMSCGYIRKWPRQMEKLAKLMYLLNSGACRPIPKGIGRLHNLRALMSLVLAPADGEAASLRDLGNLNLLQGQLTISELGASPDHVEEAQQAHLQQKKGITALSLSFQRFGDRDRADDERIVEALNPPEGLESLSISDCRASTISPSWILSLIYLTRLKLSKCEYCLVLPALGTLPCLARLEMDCFYYGLSKVGPEFLGIHGSSSSSSGIMGKIAFPKLTYLEFNLFISWKEWAEWDDDGNDMIIMPCITTLKIIRCHDLKKLPEQLIKKTTLQSLKILGGDHLVDLYGVGTGKDWDKIKHIPSVDIQEYNEYEREDYEMREREAYYGKQDSD